MKNYVNKYNKLNLDADYVFYRRVQRKGRRSFVPEEITFLENEIGVCMSTLYEYTLLQ